MKSILQNKLGQQRNGIVTGAFNLFNHSLPGNGTVISWMKNKNKITQSMVKLVETSQIQSIDIYTDASLKNKNMGIGTFVDTPCQWTMCSGKIDQGNTLNNDVVQAELLAVLFALKWFLSRMFYYEKIYAIDNTKLRIITDSTAVLHHINVFQNTKYHHINDEIQRVISNILEKVAILE